MHMIEVTNATIATVRTEAKTSQKFSHEECYSAVSVGGKRLPNSFITEYLIFLRTQVQCKFTTAL